MLVDDVKSRLSDRVPDLSGRIEGAANLVDLLRQNGLSQQALSANLIASGLQGGAVDAASGLFRQAIDETITVVLTFRSVGATGAQVLDRMDEIIRAVIDAVCGWAPEASPGVFRLVRGNVASLTAGTLVYQIDFAIADQLRIAT